MPAAAEAEAVRAALAADYDVKEVIGKGGMAVVYRAKDHSLDREVAIKVLPAAMTFDAELVDRFEREARTAGQLEHPNIVPIYRVGRAGPNNSVIYFVMKMLRGQTLSAVLRGRGRLNIDEIRQILVQTAGALSFAAKRGVVHRDIKPDNIMLDDEGRCMVTDFGIAKTTSGPQTVTGTSMGTPRYMSPEQAQGMPVDARSDIYSLGVVAYECLAGRTPFDADNPFAILYKHINDTVPRPTLTTPEQWALWPVIDRMLQKKPENRFQNADELLAALGVEVSSPTLKAAAPVRISKMTATEIIAPGTLPPEWKNKAWYRKLQSVTARFGFRVWHIGAAFGVIVVAALLTSMSIARANAVADSTRAAEAAAAKRREDSAVAARVAATNDSIARAKAAADSAARALALKQAQARAAALRAAASKTPVSTEAASRCPVAGSAALTKMANEPVILADSVRDMLVGDTLRLRYDVCGMKAGAAFTTEITLRKVAQSAFKRLVGAAQNPIRRSFPDAATGPRTRRSRDFPMTVSAGSYEAEIVATDAQGRKLTARRAFQVTAKP